MSFTDLLCLHQVVSEQMDLSENLHLIFFGMSSGLSVHEMCNENLISDATINYMFGYSKLNNIMI